MFTNQLISYYNHLLAVSLVYLSVVDPLKEIANTLSGYTSEYQPRLTNFVLADMMGQEEDYYKMLGVDRDTTKHEIHQAFRQLAKRYHPDKNKDKSATDKFIRLFKAFEILSDENKRQEYDDRLSASGHHPRDSRPSNMNNFDLDEFLKHYQDEYLRHGQQTGEYYQGQHHDSFHQDHRQQQQSHHNEFMFHGNLDDLFHDLNAHEFGPLGRWLASENNHFHSQPMDGDGASYFEPHFSSQLHQTLHQYPRQQDVFLGGMHQGAGYACHTETRQVNGMIMTQTSCS